MTFYINRQFFKIKNKFICSLFLLVSRRFHKNKYFEEQIPWVPLLYGKPIPRLLFRYTFLYKQSQFPDFAEHNKMFFYQVRVFLKFSQPGVYFEKCPSQPRIDEEHCLRGTARGVFFKYSGAPNGSVPSNICSYGISGWLARKRNR